MEPVRVRILDHEYLLKVEDSEESAQQIADYVNDKVKEIQENMEGLSENKTAILAALNIASDLFQLKKAQEELLINFRQRTASMIYHIDATMK